MTPRRRPLERDADLPEGSPIKPLNTDSSNYKHEHSYALPRSPSKLEKKLNKKIQQKEKTFNSISSKLAATRKKCKRKVSNIQNLNKLICTLQKEKFLQEKGFAVLEGFSDVGTEIVKRLHEPKNPEYSNVLKSFALTLHFYSPAGYDYVRRTLNLCLPHPNTLRKWRNTVDGKPGFTQESLLAVRERVKKSSFSVFVAISFDEMAIRKQVEWDGEKFVGYVNLGEGVHTDYVIEASQVFVIMVVSLNASWKIPIGYFLIRSLGAEEKASLLRCALELLHDVGAQCVSVTCDGLASNIKVANILGANIVPSTDMKSWFPHPVTGSKVFFFFIGCLSCF